MKYTDSEDFEISVGERIDDWIEVSLTVENGCIRLPTEDDIDNFGIDTLSWLFTQKGERLYDSYVRRANKIGELIFSDGNIDVSQHTSVIYD